MLNEKPTEIQHRGVQQLAMHQIENIQYAARSSIAILERMNGFKLIVHNGHFDKRVHFIFVVAEETLQVGEQTG